MVVPIRPRVGFCLPLMILCSGAIVLNVFGQGSPANPFPRLMVQPDNKTTFSARFKTDGKNIWWETVDGYTVIRNLHHCATTAANSCWWEYATKGPTGSLVPSGVSVTAAGGVRRIPLNRRPPKGLRP